MEAVLNYPVIIVHGGAWYIRDRDVEGHTAGCREAALVGWELLKGGAPAVDAVEAAVRVLEDNPAYDAGRGSYLNSAGRVQLDAIVMDGRTLDFGAVAAVERIRNPVSLARLVMERSEHRFVVGAGAEALAESYGVRLCDPDDLLGRINEGSWSPPRYRIVTDPTAEGGLIHAAVDPPDLTVVQGAGDTVGAVALDVSGRLAVATSTGGTPDKWPGRVGDSPLVGCGAYADDTAGAVAATGVGEALMRIVTSKTAVDMMAEGLAAQEAADAVIGKLWERVRGYGGVILIDRRGRVGLAHNTPNLAYAYVLPGQSVVAGVARETRISAPGRAEGLAAVRGLDGRGRVTAD